MLTEAMQHEGYRVIAAADGPEGVNRVVMDQPDLVLLDLKLPRLDGIEVLRVLRGQGVLIPILLLSACDQQSEVDAALELGAYASLSKPFDLNRLRELVRQRMPVVASPSPVQDCQNYC